MDTTALEKKIDKIYERLVGDDKLGNEGLVNEVKQNTEKIKKIETKQKKIGWFAIGAGLGAGAGAPKILTILSKLFSFF